jgi:hypothetical protein
MFHLDHFLENDDDELIYLVEYRYFLELLQRFLYYHLRDNKKFLLVEHDNIPLHFLVLFV